MAIVSALFAALNRRVVQVGTFYAPGAAIEGPWVDGTLALEHKRFEVARVAGIETGWGWVRADWMLVADHGERAPQAGYSYFWIEDGVIKRQRNALRDATNTNRRVSSRPTVGVGAVVLADDGRVVLVKRKHEPLAGLWSLPGGSLEFGESLEAGTAREVLEETGLVVHVGPLVELFERILVDDDHEALRFHFVIADYQCRVIGGELRAGGDADAAIFVRPDELPAYGVTEKVVDVVAKALSMSPTH
jgi:8-oxo-dGTP diphosphatase